MKYYFLITFYIFLISVSTHSYSQLIKKTKRVGLNKDYVMTFPNYKDPTHIRFEIRGGDIASNGGRAELLDYSSGFQTHYEFYFKPVSYIYENASFILADWHVSSELFYKAREGGITLFSPIIIHLENNDIILSNRAGVFSGAVNQLTTIKGASRKLFRSSIKRNEWNFISVDIKWSDQNDGEIRVNINGNKQIFSKIRTTYDMNYANYYMVGVYRSLIYKSTSIFEFKGIRVGDTYLVPDLDLEASGKKNNDENVIKEIKKKQNHKL